MRIKSRLADVMREKNVKEGDLADAANVQRATIRAMRRDVNTRIDLVVVEKLAAALGVNPLSLFEETETPRGPMMPAGAGA